MAKLLLATTNEGKIEEFKYLLSKLPIEIITLKDLGITEKVEETGKTFEENAILKAREYFVRSNIPTLADDGGLEIDYLGGEPGVKSRRWPGYEASDEELVQFTIQKLKGVPKEKRTARFRVIVAIALDRENISTFEGVEEGIITEDPVYPIIPGFPFRSVFYSPKMEGVLSTYSIGETLNLHRKQAIDKALPVLEKLVR